MDWMLPIIFEGLRYKKYNYMTDYRKGTRYTCTLFEDIAHNKILISTLLAVSNLDFELYTHATQVACIKYYHYLSQSKP